MYKGSTLAAEERQSILNFIKSAHLYTAIDAEDHAANEIIMVDQDATPYAELEFVLNFPELAAKPDAVNLSVQLCVYEGYACASREYNSRSNSFSTDILLSDRRYVDNPLLLEFDPSAPTPIVETIAAKVRSTEILLNSCANDVFDEDVYRGLVHEAGHAFGVGGGELSASEEMMWNEHARGHSTIRGSVVGLHGLNIGKLGEPEYKLEPESACSPYPYDVMALYALHQAT